MGAYGALGIGHRALVILLCLPAPFFLLPAPLSPVSPVSSHSPYTPLIPAPLPSNY